MKKTFLCLFFILISLFFNGVDAAPGHEILKANINEAKAALDQATKELKEYEASWSESGNESQLDQVIGDAYKTQMDVQEAKIELAKAQAAAFANKDFDEEPKSKERYEEEFKKAIGVGNEASNKLEEIASELLDITKNGGTLFEINQQQIKTADTSIKAAQARIDLLKLQGLDTKGEEAKIAEANKKKADLNKESVKLEVNQDELELAKKRVAEAKKELAEVKRTDPYNEVKIQEKKAALSREESRLANLLERDARDKLKRMDKEQEETQKAMDGKNDELVGCLLQECGITVTSSSEGRDYLLKLDEKYRKDNKIEEALTEEEQKHKQCITETTVECEAKGDDFKEAVVEDDKSRDVQDNSASDAKQKEKEADAAEKKADEDERVLDMIKDLEKQPGIIPWSKEGCYGAEFGTDDKLGYKVKCGTVGLSDIPRQLTYWITLVLRIIPSLGVLMAVIAAFFYLYAGLTGEGKEKANDALIYVVVGLVVAFSSWFIVDFVQSWLTGAPGGVERAAPVEEEEEAAEEDEDSTETVEESVPLKMIDCPDGKKQVDALKLRIAGEEGVATVVYYDHLRLKTLGVGHLVMKGEDASYTVSNKVDLAKVKKMYDKDFDKHLKQAKNVARKKNVDWDKLSPLRQSVLIDMAFNMGGGGLSKFVSMFKGINKKDWDEAARQIKDSKYGRGKGPRPGLNVGYMKNNNVEEFMKRVNEFLPSKPYTKTKGNGEIDMRSATGKENILDVLCVD